MAEIPVSSEQLTPIVATSLAETPLHAMHVARGARMVPFAGYDMPVQFPDGIIAEHQHTRSAAGLFDVSHMGQAFLLGPDHETTARALETLVAGDIVGLGRGRQRYTQLLNAEGGIIDDLMVTRPTDETEDGVLMLVVNAGRKADDYAHIQARLPPGMKLMPAPHRALLALQGPHSAAIMARYSEDAAALHFMGGCTTRIAGINCHVTRSGYTGEDGFEISVHAGKAAELAELLLHEPQTKPIGLGARDSLRLEAGLCLYGHDIDETTTPVEAGLSWSIAKRRREEGGFPGASVIQRQLREAPARARVGLRPEGRAPARAGAEIRAVDGSSIGVVTSGGFGPTAAGPIAMGYVNRRFSEPDSPVLLMVRDKEHLAKVVPLPFVPHRYYRGEVHLKE